ncbi:hypothetical protein D3C80_1662440 [compost metagenome]
MTDRKHADNTQLRPFKRNGNDNRPGSSYLSQQVNRPAGAPFTQSKLFRSGTVGFSDCIRNDLAAFVHDVNVTNSA